MWLSKSAKSARTLSPEGTVPGKVNKMTFIQLSFLLGPFCIFFSNGNLAHKPYYTAMILNAH